MWPWTVRRGVEAAPPGGDAPLETDAGAVARRLAGADPPLIIDVRTPAEFAGGHIPQARHLPLADLAACIELLPRECEIICVCHSGRRSLAAARHLRAAGRRAASLAGGMMEWQGPTASGGGRPL